MSETPAANEAHWVALEALLHRALEQPPEERAAFLRGACPDVALRREVEALLAAHDTRGPIDQLADSVMQPLLTPKALPSAPEEALSGHDRYRIIERLGGGGMGVVYRARDTRLERDVAMKFLPPHLSADHGAKTRFLVEARAAAALEHPNICTVHEIGDTADGQLYIVMACYDGETLDRRIARAPLDVAEAMRVTAEVARGLAKAHERGIVHRDIKPANVMVTHDGLVKILDFGIAKLSGVNVTHTVGAIGTLAYMSPEQAFGEQVDHRTDVWSLGVVLYEMLTGLRPFRGPGEQSLLVAALTSDPESVRVHRPELPPEMDVLIRRALAKQPSERFENAIAMMQAVLACPTTITPAALVGGHALVDSKGGTGPVRENDPGDSTLAHAGERRQVTLVASTVAGHDLLVERLSPERADAVMARIRDAAHEVATQFGGIVNHFGADQFVVLFGVPTAHEDDAVRGVRAALAMHTRMTEIAAELEARWSSQLRLRSGIHTGLVVAQRLRQGDRRYRISGPPSELASRLSAHAQDDAILMSPETRRLVAPFIFTGEAPALHLGGQTGTVMPHRVLGSSDVRSRFEGITTALTPFVGREQERALLAQQWQHARDGAGRMVVLVGEAGAGKSRLLHELRESATADGARMLAGRCDAYGSGTPFLPFVEAAQELLQLDRRTNSAERHDTVVLAVRALDRSLDEFLPLYLALLSIPSDAHPVPDHLKGELFQVAMLSAVAALFTTGAQSAPAVLLLEDWHWADEGSRAALRQMVEVVSAVPLCIVVTSRPDMSLDWGSSEHHTVLHLPPLDTSASEAIACAVLGADRVSTELVARLHERTGGNPFFLEEVCEALREEGAVLLRDGLAVLPDDTGALHVPETIQGVLRTRMDRLDAEARDVLRVASVVGREFSRGVLEDVVESNVSLTRALDRLKQSGLVQQMRVVPEAVYRFKHALTEEVAYDSLLEHQRHALHDRVGAAIEARYTGQLEEQVERLVHHFSRAESWVKAVRYGMQSADRAAVLNQYADAMATLEKVQEWLTFLADGGEKEDLETDLLLRQERICEALGLRMRQMGIVATLVSRLVPGGPSERLAQAYLRQGDAYTLLRRYSEAEEALRNSLSVADALGNTASRRNALRSLALLRSHEARHEEALETIQQVIAMGHALGDPRAEAGDLATMANILRALGQHQRALDTITGAIASGHVDVHSLRYGALLNVMATVYRDLGLYDQALDYYRQTAGLLSNSVYASFSLPGIAFVQLQQGHVEDALSTYREAVALNKKIRYADGSAHACRSLGEVLVGLKRDAEAVPYLRDAAALFRQLEDHENEALMWRRLAMAHETLRQFDDATAAWNQVLVYVRAGAPLNEAEATDGLSRAQLGTHNAAGIQCWQRGAFDEALSHFEAGLRLCEETSDRVHEGLMRNSVAATLLRLQQPARAIPILQRSIEVTMECGEHTLQVHALLTLTRAFMATAARESALSVLAQARNLVGTLHDDTIAAAVERLQHDLVSQSSAAATPVA
ncbi:hypothetical protein GEMMAAP_15145 [Gemmatimonas phototrophica]|uniref:non-specific serine/threonine protein kinase n=1 Tax=Gemmatimonas phototrophica TaxID=1379270 RepID=A0A143BMN8_9BACT|nr:hypothetical protein GEMMAAP_15145 [Gemmatimonas phototrophica]